MDLFRPCRNMGRDGNPDIELPGFAFRGCFCHNRLLFLAQEETPEVHTKENKHKHASLAVMHSFTKRAAQRYARAALSYISICSVPYFPEE